MPLTATPSEEVPQTLASATSKRGLNSEAQAALLRVRTGPECPEGNLRELTWDSNPNCGIAREKKNKEQRERENFPTKTSNLKHCQATHRTKDWANTRGELASSGPAHPRRRQAGRRTPARARRQGANLAPETASSTKLRAGSQLLTKSSWDPGLLTSAKGVTARDQLHRGDTQHTWNGTSAVHPGNRAAGTGEMIRRTDTGSVRSTSTWSPELLGPGKGTKHWPNWVCAFVEYPRTWTWVA